MENYLTNFGQDHKNKDFGTAVAYLIAFVIVILIAPFVTFWSGYFVGIIAKMTIGNSFVLGASKLGFPFKVEDIPLIFGFLNCVGFILCSNSLKVKKKD